MSISKLALAAKKVIDAAWLHGDAYDLSSQAAFALESAQLLQSPDTAVETQRLTRQVIELQENVKHAARAATGARREADLLRERVSEPHGCKYCGEAERSHGRQYVIGAGLHAWERPTDEQVKDRMLARRVARFSSNSEHLAQLLVARTEELLKAEDRITELEQQRQADHETWQHDLRTARSESEATAVRLAELEAERHTTNEALDDAVQALRERREDGVYPQGTAQRVQRREHEDQARCLDIHAFSPRDGWRMICGSCDHSAAAKCHHVEAGGR